MRCVPNFLVNRLAGLIAYTYQDKEPSLHIQTEDLGQPPVLL